MKTNSIDLGIAGSAPVGVPANTGYDLTQGPSWRRALHVSTALQQAGMSGDEVVIRTLEHLRPHLNSRDASIRAHATLRKDEWKQLDDRVAMAFQEELVAVADLQARGLRTNLGNPFATTIFEWENISEMTPANVSMYATTPPQDDRLNWTLVGIPVPVISKGFFLDERVLAAGRQRGQGIDVSSADAATRVCSEMLETLLFTGGGITYGGYSLTGYTNTPGINTGSLAGSWLTLSTTNPGAIVNDVIRMKQACRTDFVNGPFMIYVPNDWIDALGRSYFETTAASPSAVTGLVAPNQTIMQRLLAIEGILGVRATTQLTTGAVLVDMNIRTVDMIFGFEPRLISWESQGGMGNHFRVMSIMSFRVRGDYAGRSGIAYYT